MQRFLSTLHLCIEPFLFSLGCKRVPNHGTFATQKYLKINHVRGMSERRILSNDALGWGIGKREANEHRQVVYQFIDLRQVITSHSESTDFYRSSFHFRCFRSPIFQGTGETQSANGIMQGLPQDHKKWHSLSKPKMNHEISWVFRIDVHSDNPSQGQTWPNQNTHGPSESFRNLDKMLRSSDSSGRKS